MTKLYKLRTLAEINLSLCVAELGAVFAQRREVRSPDRKTRLSVVRLGADRSADANAGDGSDDIAFNLSADEMRRLTPDMRGRNYAAHGDAELDLPHAITCEVHMDVRREYPVYAEQDPDTEEWTAKIPGVSFVLTSGRTLEELRRRIEHQLPTLIGRLRALSAGPDARVFSPKSP
jgi:hypothetical protein